MNNMSVLNESVLEAGSKSDTLSLRSLRSRYFCSPFSYIFFLVVKIRVIFIVTFED